MSANEKQVAGNHYQSKIQHWDYVVANELDYFQAQITKYVTRWKKKNGLQDLRKAQHFLEKYIELNSPIPAEESPQVQQLGLFPAEQLSHIYRGEYLTITKDQVFPPIQQELKYAPDYQERLSEDMAKMRNDAMRGVPDHIRKDVIKPWYYIGYNSDTKKFGYRCLSCKHEIFVDTFGDVDNYCPECGYDGDGHVPIDKGYVAQE